jgi:hypothetical protein
MVMALSPTWAMTFSGIGLIHYAHCLLRNFSEHLREVLIEITQRQQALFPTRFV